MCNHGTVFQNGYINLDISSLKNYLILSCKCSGLDSFYSSFWNSIISPTWQSSTSQIAASVEKRMAVTLLFFILDRLTFEMPTFSANSLSDMWRSTIIRSSLRTIFPICFPRLQNTLILQSHSHTNFT